MTFEEMKQAYLVLVGPVETRGANVVVSIWKPKPDGSETQTLVDHDAVQVLEV